jgi:glutaredoxin 3
VNGLVLLTTTTCGPCRNAKAWLNQRNIPFQEINLDHRPDLVPWMVQQTGQQTVPQFFLDGKWIAGGFRAVQAQFGG